MAIPHSQAQTQPTTRSTGPYQTLYGHEITWRDRQPFLESRGYMLRPRLRPGWTPSWLRTGAYFLRAEDSVPLPVCRNDLTRNVSHLSDLEPPIAGRRDPYFGWQAGIHQTSQNE